MSVHRRFCRLEYERIPIYIDPAEPDWFVPSSRLDCLLQCLEDNGGGLDAFSRRTGTARPEAEQMMNQVERLLQRPASPPYAGRHHYLTLGAPKELWIHLTDRCNLQCRHCLFASAPTAGSGLDRERLLQVLDQAAGLGCRVFYFTGGEPFVYSGLVDILDHVQSLHSDCICVVLTNGLLLRQHQKELARLDPARLYLQVSVDGLEAEHDRLRGPGSFVRLRRNLQIAAELDLATTISMAVNRGNLHCLSDLARQVRDLGGTGLHLMYHFVRGKGSDQQFVPPDRLAPEIRAAAAACTAQGIAMDNLQALEAQVFTTPGTRHDLNSMGWESLALGPDNTFYPSPVLVRIPDLACGRLEQGLKEVWQHSRVLEHIRHCSLVDQEDWHQQPLALLTGGGDPDHSWIAGRTLVGDDPYLPLYEDLILWLIASRATTYPDQGLFRLRMGDIRRDCPDSDNGSRGRVSLTHCNCVVALAGRDGHSPVKEFYASAARSTNRDIVNPFGPRETATSFIPARSTDRSYGCGSPVQDAAIRTGEVVVDLGSGSGVECFLAAEQAGAGGRVYGIDMTDDMLALARNSLQEVRDRLGYGNVCFCKGLLERIPLRDGSVDVVISNCVINLSTDKRRTYLEIHRILKPGGRLIISDIVTDQTIDLAIRNNLHYRGQCLGGAMRMDDLMVMLEDCGFSNIYLHRRYPYREIDGNRFYALTYAAEKPVLRPKKQQPVAALYRGPGRALITGTGILLPRGEVVPLTEEADAGRDDSIFLLDDRGTVTNVEQAPCSCSVAPEEQPDREEDTPGQIVPLIRHRQDCMLCGAELHYETESTRRTCHFCGTSEETNTSCIQGHYICNRCHQAEGLTIIRHICLTSREQDMIRLLGIIRSHPSVPMHGPEHHALVPGVILAACRNAGGPVKEKTIAAAIERGSKVPGGACGFWGSCGAAIGAGIAASLILEATPLTPHPRQQAQEFTARILTSISRIEGGRCCQRETWLALRRTAALSQHYFAVNLRAEGELACDQYSRNRECIRNRCPLWKNRQKSIQGLRKILRL